MAKKRKHPRPHPYEGSKPDKLADAREAKKRGMSMKDWENSPADMAMDRAAAAPPPAPMPGRTDFSAGEEQAMRAGQRASRMPPPMPDDTGSDLGGL